jgi:hypothetical protein
VSIGNSTAIPARKSRWVELDRAMHAQPGPAMMSLNGPLRHFAAPNNNVAFGVTTDIDWHGHCRRSGAHESGGPYRERFCQTASACRIRFVIASGREISARWLAFTSIVFAPIRLAMKRSRSGLIVRCSVWPGRVNGSEILSCGPPKRSGADCALRLTTHAILIAGLQIPWVLPWN